MEHLKEVVNRLREMFSLNNLFSTEQLLHQVKTIISDFPILRQQPYRVAINNLVISEAREKCILVLDEKKVEACGANR